VLERSFLQADLSDIGITMWCHAMSFNQLDEVKGVQLNSNGPRRARYTAVGWFSPESTAENVRPTKRDRNHIASRCRRRQRSAADARAECRNRRCRKLPLSRGGLMHPIHLDRHLIRVLTWLGGRWVECGWLSKGRRHSFFISPFKLSQKKPIVGFNINQISMAGGHGLEDYHLTSTMTVHLLNQHRSAYTNTPRSCDDVADDAYDIGCTIHLSQLHRDHR